MSSTTTRAVQALVRTFVLHDGEDENRTKELHELLDGVEWEGDETGISVYLHARPGDKIHVNRDDEFGVIMIGVEKREVGP